MRAAYKARGEPLWNVLKAEDDIDKATRGAFVAILTRSFTQEAGDEEKRLVPLLDMLQHATEPNVRHVAAHCTSRGDHLLRVHAGSDARPFG